MSRTADIFDTPGPRARRRARWLSGTFVVVLAAVAALCLQKLSGAGQLSSTYWGPIGDPGDPEFGPLWQFLASGLLATLEAAGLALAFSALIGTWLGVTRHFAGVHLRRLLTIAMDILRAIPVVVSIFFAAIVLPSWGLSLPLVWYVLIGITAYHAIAMAEIVRAGIAALPKGQTEAARAIGLSHWQTVSLIILPQAFRVMLAAFIAQMVRVLKDTSLGFIVSYDELLRRGEIAVQDTNNPLQMYFVIGLVYIALNLLLKWLARSSQRQWAPASGRSGAPALPGTEAEGVALEAGLQKSTTETAV